MSNEQGTPGRDLQSILDALAKAAVVVIGACAIAIVAILAHYTAEYWGP